MKYCLLFLCCTLCVIGWSQVPDAVYFSNIKTPQLFGYGNQLAYPAIRLNSNDKLELQFDDLDANVKNYFYTYQLCNEDWTPADVSQSDYIKGFPQSPISVYSFSSLALTKYTHYQAIVPEVNCVPSLSGNYLLKIFLDGDTSKLAFTKRLLVIDNAVNIGAQILQPFNPALSHTHQKLQFTITTRSLQVVNAAQQIKVILLQNNRWDNAIHISSPSFYNANILQYNSDDDNNFPAGKEWRWVDIQSFRYLSDRIKHAEYGKSSTDLFIAPDGDRSAQPYYYYKDYNGLFYIQTTESINPYLQTDYASAHFSFVPPGNTPFADKDVYLLGQLTGYALNDSTKMTFNAEKGVYEVSVLLKQGVYSYTYVTIGKDDPARAASFEFTEGNNFETENDYTILVYFSTLGGRTDQLVGMARLNTLNSKPVN